MILDEDKLPVHCQHYWPATGQAPNAYVRQDGSIETTSSAQIEDLSRRVYVLERRWWARLCQWWWGE